MQRLVLFSALPVAIGLFIQCCCLYMCLVPDARRSRLSAGAPHRLLATSLVPRAPASPGTDVGRRLLSRSCSDGAVVSGESVDVDADLQAALAQEQLDGAQLAPLFRGAVRKLWEDDRCRVHLRGQLRKFTAAAIDWKTLVDVYRRGEEEQRGETVLRDFIETNAQLTPGAAHAISCYVDHQIRLSRRTFDLTFLVHNQLEPGCGLLFQYFQFLMACRLVGSLTQ